MTADFSHLATLPQTLQVLAQAYGTSTYNSNSYNGNISTSTTTPAPLPPNTGFLMQSPLVDIPLLLILAIIVGTISFAISRHVKRRNRL